MGEQVKSKLWPSLFPLVIFLLLLSACRTSDVNSPPDANSASPAAAVIQTSIPTPPTPQELANRGAFLPQIPRITAEGLKVLIDGKTPMVLVDTRAQSLFEVAHLPGAINIPFDPEPPVTEEWVSNALFELPRDKLLIFYCE